MIIVTIAGRLTKDAETRTAGSTTVTGFGVAGSTGFGEREATLFFSASIWGKRGSAIEQYLTKGSQVTVVGELSEREYNGKMYKEINVSEIALQGGGQQSQDNAKQEQSIPPASDDVPF